MSNIYTLGDGQFKAGTVERTGSLGFGFIRPDETGPSVYFRHDVGMKIRSGVELPEFQNERLDRLPRVGDLLVYIEGRGDRGPIARVWGYLCFYEEAMLRIANRSKFRIVRVNGEQVGSYGEILAEGTAEQISVAHPRYDDGTDEFDSWLNGHRVIFQRQMSDGLWKTHDRDPRSVTAKRKTFSVTPRVVFEKKSEPESDWELEQMAISAGSRNTKAEKEKARRRVVR